MPINQLENKILAGQQISETEAESLFTWDLLKLGKLADHSRSRRYPGEEIGFIVDRIINYTNICEAACKFCAFHAKANQVKAYDLSIEEICTKVDELVELGGSQVMLQGGLHPDNTLEKFVTLVSTIKRRHPKLFLHSFSPSEIVHIAKKQSLEISRIVGTLKKAGLDSIPGASDLLVPRIRNEVSPNKATVEEWCRVMEALAEHDMKSSATMTYGMGETLGEKIQHLSVIRQIQEQTGIIRAFIPWSFSAPHTRMTHLPPSTGVDYLKIVAIGRIFLDNVQYIQAGWLTEGMKLAQLALTMGANDMGGVLMEEVVVKATGIETTTNINEMVALIRNAGKIPILRDSAYKKIRVME